MLEGLEALRRSEYVDAYYMAANRLALGQRREALAELDRAFRENSARLYTLAVDPTFDELRSEPEFPRLQRSFQMAGRRGTTGGTDRRSAPPARGQRR